MFRRASGFVSVLLPLAALTLIPGCGSAPGEADSVNSASGSEREASSQANTPPTIDRPADAYARAGEPFTYQPVSNDTDGDALRFTAQNLPPWASIDPATGNLTGTPTLNDAGVYEDIVITVADASHTTRSASFVITVVGDGATGTATLRWELPPSKVDGAPLDDLAGYRILFGRDSANLDRSVLIDDPAVTSFEFTELPAGIWYFAVVAVNTGGLEGPPTTITMKSI